MKFLKICTESGIKDLAKGDNNACIDQNSSGKGSDLVQIKPKTQKNF